MESKGIASKSPNKVNYLRQLKELQGDKLKSKIIEFLEKKYITVDELLKSNSLKITGKILYDIGCMYKKGIKPFVKNLNQACKFFEKAHDERNASASYELAIYQKKYFLEEKDLSKAKKIAEKVIYYSTTAKERGYPEKTKIDEILIEIGTKFFDLAEYEEAIKFFSQLESASSIYHQALVAYEQNENDKIIKLINSAFTKIYAEELYKMIFAFDDSEGNYNKILKTIVNNISKTLLTLLKILEIASEKNDEANIEILLEYGLDLGSLDFGKNIASRTWLDSLEIVKQYKAIKLPNLNILKFKELIAKSIEELKELKGTIVEITILDDARVQYLRQINRTIALKKFPDEYAIEFIRRKPTGKILPETVSATYYILINSKLTVLPDGANTVEIINKLITTLLYETKRHGFDSQICKNVIRIIKRLDQRLTDFSEEGFQKLLNRREIRSHNFFGEDLSDDSDNELDLKDEPKIKKLLLEKQKMEQLGISWVKDGVQRFTLFSAKENYQKRQEQLLPERKTLENKQPYLNFNARVIIPYDRLSPDLFEQAKKDLVVLNRYLKNGKSIPEAIGKITTKFFIAQYRGITYSTSKWNASSRRAHRTTDETKIPSFSASVYHAAQFNIFSKFDSTKYNSKETQLLLTIIAEKLELMLIAMRKTEEFKSADNNYTYDNLAEFTQDMYSKDLDKFHQAIADDGLLSEHRGKFLLNDRNPFVSTGDRPYHSLRYAYGSKPYSGKEEERLRPRWNNRGEAERPYSGKVYLSLHPLTDYDENGPMHVVSLIAQGKLNIVNNIVAERETSFPAYIKEDRMVYQHIARYPSFSRAYHPKYSKKYGLDEELYKLFQDAFQKYPPHSYENRYLKKILSNWLCAYQEKKLVEIAFREANKQDGILIYKNTENTYTFDMPEYGVWNGRTNKEEIDLSREYRKI